MAKFIQTKKVTEPSAKSIEISKKLDMLLTSLNRVYPSTRKMMWRSFVNGIFTALGATIGLSIVLALVTFALTQLRGVPVVNQFLDQTQVEKVLPKK